MIQRLKPFNLDPYDRPNDDWHRVPQYGVDATQPESYVRTSSLRFNRKKFTFALTAFVIGALVILMQSPVRNEFIAPGPLASNHAQILAGEGANRCAACHDAGNKTFGEWLVSAFRPGNNAQACQSDLCMQCHNKSIQSEFATKPHNVSPEVLERISCSYRTGSNRGLMQPIDHQGEIECSACHREHHGQEDLAALTDQQCQTCHAEHYRDFEFDHPEFSKWPQKHRQRIAFDHASHAFKHFPGQKSEFDCQTCHVDDRFHNVKLLASYETACATCHQEDIDGRNEPGLALVSLPMLDLEAIQGNAMSVGAWPEDASGDFDGELPELMRLLLFQDDSARSILEKRSLSFGFSDLDPASPDDVADAVQLTWALKYMLYDLATHGENELRKRMEYALGRSLSSDEFHVITGGLNAAVFAKAVNQWLPALASEVPARRAGSSEMRVSQMINTQPLRYYLDKQNRQLDSDLLTSNPIGELDKQSKPSALSIKQTDPISSPAQPRLSLSRSDPAPSGSQVKVTRNEQAIGMPQIANDELLAENPLAQLISTSGVPSSANYQPNEDRRARTQPNVNSSPQASIEIESSKQETQPRIQVAPDQIAESELLADNPLINLLNENAPSVSNSLNNPPSAGIANTDQDDAVVREFVEKVAETQQKTTGFMLPNDTNEHLIGSMDQAGWYRNDEIFQISYRPSGHADRVLTVLADVVSQTPESDTNPATAAFFNKMTSNNSVGACNLCHTTDSRDDSSFQVHWQPQYRDPAIRSFIRFSHGPHLFQPELSDCTNCHALDPDRANAQTFVDFNGQNAVSNFAPISKMNCAGCHREGGAGSKCIDCHNYHIGSRVSVSN